MHIIFWTMSVILGFSMSHSGGYQGFDYEKAWQKVTEFRSQGLPKSALAEVDIILSHAKADKNVLQLTKAVKVKSELTIETDENGLDLVITRVQKEIEEASEPARQILSSYLAEIYYQYYQSYRYEISERSYVPDADTADYKSWNSQDFHQKILGLYLASIQGNKLQSSLDGYKELLVQPNDYDAFIRPTLYTVLWDRLTKYLQDMSGQVTLSLESQYIMENPALLGNVQSFISVPLTDPAKEDPVYLILQAYQKILDHSRQTNMKALADYDLSRLNFVHDQSVIPYKDSLYEQALTTLLTTYASNEYVTKVYHALAVFYLGKERDEDAFALCQKALDLFPESPGAIACKNTMEQILKPEADMTVEQVYASSESPRFALDYKNLKNVTIQVYRAPNTPMVSGRYSVQERAADLLASSQLIYTKTWELPQGKLYGKNQMEAILPEFPFGKYVVTLSRKGENGKPDLLNFAVFYVSDLSVTSFRDKDENGYRVTDRMTGKPVKGAKVTLYQVEYRDREQKMSRQKLRDKLTDKKGWVYFASADNKRIQVVAEHGKDKLDIGHDSYQYKYHEGNRDFTFAEIFTDRAIYRPGQTTYFKAIAIRSDGKGKSEVMTDIPVEVSLHDANYQVISTLSLKTNEFGSVTGSFAIPAGILTGTFNITVQSKKGVSGQKYIRVEEYKRPKFEVLTDTFKDAYILGQPVKVTGMVKNFAGNPVDNAEVSFKVVRAARFIDWGWWWRPAPAHRQSERVIAYGKVTSDQDGAYTFEFTAIPDETIPPNDRPVFDYSIQVSATDATGETNEANATLSVGYASLSISSGLGEQEDLQTMKPFFIQLNNMQGIAQKGKGKIEVEKLAEPKTCYQNKYWNDNSRPVYVQELRDKGLPMPLPASNRFDEWKVEKKVWQGEFTTEKPVLHTIFKTAGVYRMRIETEDVHGNKVLSETYHVMTDFNNKKFPKTDPLHVKVTKPSVEPGEQLEINLGAAEKPLYASLLVEKEGRVVFREEYKINAALHFSYPVTENHRGGLYIHVQYVYKNRNHTQSIFVDVPYSNKELAISLETFREKIYPGSEETYSFVVSGKKKDAVLAEFMTTMFDASLETFEVNTWRQSFYDRYYCQLFKEAIGFQGVYNTVVNQDWNRFDYLGYDSYVYPALQGVQVYRYGMVPGAYNNMMRDEILLESRTGNARVMSKSAVPSMAESDSFDAVTKTEKTGSSDKPEPPAVRKNLAELVFFYPQLKTDDKGNVRFSFTMNEALTRWKMMSWAHTPDMKVGYDERYLQTYKKVMVFPNPPRFVRTSDKIVLTAKVVNTMPETLPVSVQMKLLNTLTGEDVTHLFVTNKPQGKSSLGPESSEGYTWEIKVPEDYTGTLTWSVIAMTNGHSDGEENIIPVLTNRILVTETLPLYVHGKQKKIINFDAFAKNVSGTKQDKRFTLEYTSHPVWYVVQALPYLAGQSFENTEHIVNRYFANAVSSGIAKSNPRISAVFDQWKSREPDALLSKLSTNQELKSALSEETPWVMQGLKEEEQKRNIALLFETNQLKNELKSTFQKLRERQMANGSFPWYVNGRSDLYVTQYIVETFGQLKVMGIIGENDTEITDMIRKALAYIDAEQLYWYKKNKEAATGSVALIPVSSMGYHYLYIRSFFPEINWPEENQEVYNYYFKKAKEEWLQQNLYTQVMIGIIMKRAGDKTADAIKKSFEERSFTREESGKFWNAGNGYRWDELPIERQAKMIEFYKETGDKGESLSQMKLWLLKNKQTRNWPTTKATASAIYALLLEGEKSGTISWLEDNQPVVIQLGGEKVEFEQKQAGTGYVKKQWSDQVFPKKWSNISVDNPNAGTSWGAVYYQYFEESDKIQAMQNNPLKISKSVFLVTQTNKGVVLDEIKEGSRLNPGDKIKIRLKISSDRSIDYVHVKDSRASGFEPLSVLSGHKYQGGLSYYENIKDMASHFFISHLPKGDFILEYDLKVVHRGSYSAGLATIQSMYAPEFSSHSSGVKIIVE